MHVNNFDRVNYRHNSSVLNISSLVQVGDLGASGAMMLLETNLAKQSIFPNKVISTFRYPVRTYYEEASGWFFSRMEEALFVDITKVLWKTRKLALWSSCHQTLRSSDQFFGTWSIAPRKWRQRTRRSTAAASAQLGNVAARPLVSASSPCSRRWLQSLKVYPGRIISFLMKWQLNCSRCFWFLCFVPSCHPYTLPQSCWNSDILYWNSLARVTCRLFALVGNLADGFL